MAFDLKSKNIGIEAASKGEPCTTLITPATLRRVAEVGAAIVITVYAPSAGSR
jgi:hypothetical protein